MTTETKGEWGPWEHNINNETYVRVRKGVNPRTIYDDGVEVIDANFLNALQACADALPLVTEMADDYAGERELGTVDSQPITNAQAAIARLRSQQDAAGGTA